MAERRPHSSKTVGHNGHPNAAATDQNPALKLSPGDLLGHDGSNVWVIHGGFAGHAEVFHIDVLFFQVPPQVFFKFKAGVVAADDDFHFRVQIS